MVEWLFGAVKISLIGVGVVFVLVFCIAIWIIISIVRDMRKMEKKMDRW